MDEEITHVIEADQPTPMTLGAWYTHSLHLWTSDDHLKIMTSYHSPRKRKGTRRRSGKSPRKETLQLLLPRLSLGNQYPSL
jgi:hypothetical protein